MTNRVSPTDARPTHDVLLKDLSGKQVALICVDATGKHLDTIQRDPYPTSATKIYSGTQTYADSEPPFTPEVQQDWSGGRGSEVMDADATRYADGFCVDPSRGGKILLGGLATYATGYRKVDQQLPGFYDPAVTWSPDNEVTWKALSGTTMGYAMAFAASATYESMNIEFIIRKVGTPPGTAITAAIYSDNGSGLPNALLKSTDLLVTSVDDVIGVHHKFTFATHLDLTAATVYHAVITIAVAGTTANHWEVACHQIGPVVYINTGSKLTTTTWANDATSCPYFRITDLDAPFIGHFFEYKGQLYFATEPDDNSAGVLWMNGDRGACDSNSAQISNLVDASKTWVSDEWKNCIARVQTGRAGEERQNWRPVAMNDGTHLTAYYPWKIEHDLGTEYVVLGSNKFVRKSPASTLRPTKPITNTAVANDIMYLAQGAQAGIMLHREYYDQAVDTWYDIDRVGYNAWADGVARANQLCVQRDQIKGSLLWMAYYDLTLKQQFVNYDQVTKAWVEKILSGAILDDGTDAWNEDTIANVTTTYEQGQIKISVAVGFTTGIVAVEAITSTDIRYSNRVQVGYQVASTIDHDAGDLQFMMDNTAKCASPLFTINLPALKANVWTTVILDYDAKDITAAAAIISIGLNLTVDKGAEVIAIKGMTQILDTYPPIPVEDIGRINKVLMYGQPAVPWVVGEGGLGEIREDVYQQAPIWDIRNASSPANGVAAIAHDVYLDFSFGYSGGVQQYYATNIDDIGPNGDMGLPDNRKGPVVDLVGWPGRIYAAIDAGPSGYSSVQVRMGQGWHEAYRAPRVGERIRSLFLQSIPGTDIRRLWISQGSDILWIPISQNPEYDTNFRYTYEGALTSGRVYSSMQDIAKFYNSIKLATKNLTSNVTVKIDYRLDGATAWTTLPTTFTTSPFQQVAISSTYNATGKWIEYRLRLETNDVTKTPVVLAIVLDIVTRNKIAYAFPLTFRVFDKDVDLNGQPDDEEIGKNKIDQLDAWIAGSVPIIMCSTDSLAHNMWVFPEPVPVRRVAKIFDEAGHEGHVCTCTMLALATYTP